MKTSIGASPFFTALPFFIFAIAFRSSFGESVPPQWRPLGWTQPNYGGGTSYAPWVDEVWQIVCVDGALNNPPDSAYFIHQSGVYLKTIEQTTPFYSPVIAQWYNSEEKSFTVVNWGQQAHTEDLLNIDFTSKLLYYTKYTCCHTGIIQVDQMMYNFGDDNMSFLNVPWGGVRHSNLGHTFLSSPDDTYEEITGLYGQTPVIQTNQTGGWVAWSNDSNGSSPALAIVNTTSTVSNGNVLRYGDAANLEAAWNDRDYSVLEMIRFPNEDQLSFGTSMSFRYFYVIDESIDAVRDVISDLNLKDQAFDTDFTPLSMDVESLGYFIDLLPDNSLVLENSSDPDAWQLRATPFQDSYPIFHIQGENGQDHITSDPYVITDKPWDGQTSSWSLLGFRSNPLIATVQRDSICAGDDYQLPSGVTLTNVQNNGFFVSELISSIAGVDSLVFSNIHVQPGDAFYKDDDQDGFGDLNELLIACAAPEGYISNNTDCDDANNAIYPGAPGTAEGLDNNCNGIIDQDENSICLGDFNSSGSIEVFDFLIFLALYGCDNLGCVTDLNNDSITDSADLLLFLIFYGTSCD